jgi:hypothetical protein
VAEAVQWQVKGHEAPARTGCWRLATGDWRPHDLRRTAVTLAQRAGCPLDAIPALPQRKTAGVIGVSARHAHEDEKRLVVTAIADQVKRILNGWPVLWVRCV